jgi:hypothetical protein
MLLPNVGTGLRNQTSLKPGTNSRENLRSRLLVTHLQFVSGSNLALLSCVRHAHAYVPSAVNTV